VIIGGYAVGGGAFLKEMPLLPLYPTTQKNFKNIFLLLGKNIYETSNRFGGKL
jgi:hypothetical protein